MKKQSDHIKLKIITEKAKKQNNNFAIFVNLELYPNQFKISKSKIIFLNLNIIFVVTIVKTKRIKNLIIFKMFLIIALSGNSNLVM